MTDIEKMDVLRKRFDITYAQAKEVLQEAEGDTGAAQTLLEDRHTPLNPTGGGADGGGQSKNDTEDFVKGVIEQIKAIIQEGNVTKVRLKKGDETLIEIPATIGVVGLGMLLFSPLVLAVTAIGAAAAVAKELVFEIEKKDGSIERRFLKWPEVVREKQTVRGDANQGE